MLIKCKLLQVIQRNREYSSVVGWGLRFGVVLLLLGLGAVEGGEWRFDAESAFGGGGDTCEGWL